MFKKNQDRLASCLEGEMGGKDRKACGEERNKKHVAPEANWGELEGLSCFIKHQSLKIRKV